MIGNRYESQPVTYADAREGYLRPQVRFGIRAPVEGCILNYHCCDIEQCGGYFATARGLADHKAFVHAS